MQCLGVDISVAEGVSKLMAVRYRRKNGGSTWHESRKREKAKRRGVKARKAKAAAAGEGAAAYRNIIGLVRPGRGAVESYKISMQP